jgi:probable HAF family extracellular repeat protein
MRDLGALPLGGGSDMPDVSQAEAINDGGLVIGTSFVHQNDPEEHAFVWSSGKMTALPCPASRPLSDARSVNAHGWVAGSCDREDPGSGRRDPRAVVWRGGQRWDLGPPDRRSVATGVNDRGQIVGTIEGRAFIWQNGTVTQLGTTPSAGRSSAVAINNLGQVVGTSGEHAFLWQNGKTTDLGALGGWRYSEADGINERGQVIGWSYPSIDAAVAGTYRAFVWEKGRIRSLGTLGGRSSSAAAINDRSQIVGQSATKSGALHPFVWENGRMTDLGTLPRTTECYAAAINDRSHIAGSCMGGDFAWHAVLWRRR